MRVKRRWGRRGGGAESALGSESAPPLRWERFDASESPQHPGLIDRLIDQLLDGMTVSTVFAPDEVERALSYLEDHHGDRTDWAGGTLLGMPIGLIGPDNQQRGPYFDDTEKCRRLYSEAFGFDPHARLTEVLRPMTTLEVSRPLSEDGRQYNPGQVRWYEPGMGGLRAHAGNEFTDLSRHGAMSHLVETLRIEDHLSYFIVLQKPDSGGSLSVFDLLFKDYPDHPVPWGSADRDDQWFDSVSFTTIDPGPGDLVLFGGGWRWHRVEPIHGTRPRITLGGFAAPSRTADELHFWT